MRVAIFGKKLTEEAYPYVKQLYDVVQEMNIETITYHKFAKYLTTICIPNFSQPTYTKLSEIEGEIDFLISIGGDGTILDTVTSIGDSEIPILGINAGRLGFLANNAKDEIVTVLEQLVEGKFRLEKRSLLSLQMEGDTDNIFGPHNFALNEITLHKKDSASMLTLHTYIDGEFLNSYWADGLIIATPTGSTAYSLSCGGPILDPASNNIIINPIAPHNLTARPVIVPDNVVLTIRVEGRGDEFLATLDSRSKAVIEKSELTIKKANFHINLVQFEDQNFFRTIRNKLLWGHDKRN